jgi:hypothetical protein
MTVSYPGGVETQLFTQFDDLECRLVTPARIGLVEQPDRQEAELSQGFRGQRHCDPPSSATMLR